MSEKEKFDRERIGLMANDLNNIIQEILGYIELIQENRHEPDKVESYSQVAARSAARATQISSILGTYAINKAKGATAAAPQQVKTVPTVPLVPTSYDFNQPLTAEEIALKVSRPISNPLGEKPLVLVVDDEKDNCSLLELILTIVNYKVVTAYNGWEACSLYRQYKGQIELVLLDMVMPGMGGDVTFKSLKQMDANAKVFIVSGHQDAKLVQSLISQGVIGFLAKPYTREKLIECVDKAVGIQERLSDRVGKLFGLK